MPTPKINIVLIDDSLSVSGILALLKEDGYNVTFITRPAVVEQLRLAKSTNLCDLLLIDPIQILESEVSSINLLMQGIPVVCFTNANKWKGLKPTMHLGRDARYNEVAASIKRVLGNK